MVQLVDIFDFLTVVLRAAMLAAQSLTLGGIIFALWVARPLGEAVDAGGEAVLRSSRRLITWSALALAVTEALAVLVNAAILGDMTGIPWAQVVGANFFLTGTVTIAAALGMALLARVSFDRALPWLLLLSAVILTASAITSHAASRLEDRVPLAVVTALHQVAAAAWIGGIPYLLVALRRCPEGRTRQLISRRFSRMAMVSVAVLVAAGATLTVVYTDSLDAMYGTAYGLMLASKVTLLAVLLLLGAMNSRLVKRLWADPGTPIVRLWRFAEVEIGIGFTVFLAAASLTAQTPAVDVVVADRASATEIAERMTPHWPRLTSPAHAELSQAQRDAAAASGAPAAQAYAADVEVTHPNTAADIAWSEYNHHWAGFMVLLIGLLALAERSGHASWARHWPLLFLALAVFLFLRSDSENWPLGDTGFFESFQDPEVAQHRMFIFMIAAFGLFEWAVRTGRIVSARAALVFPLMCSLGGALLLTHQHLLGNVKAELLIELTHVPLAVLGVIAGWARWLELRLPLPDRRAPAWLWPVCFMLIGALLLLYRES